MSSHNLNKLIKDQIKPVETLLYESDQVKESLQKIKEKHLDPRIIYFYVIDQEGKLKGFLSTRTLLLSDGEKKIKDIMDTSVIKLFNNSTYKQAMEHFASNSLLAIPVVDENNKMLGVVDVDMYTDGAYDIANARHRSDLFQIIGYSLEDEKGISILKGYRFRMPWIFCNMIGGILCAIISRFNEHVLSQVIVLAMFIPLVLTLSESISMQAMTHSLQYIRRPRFSLKSSFLKALREWQIIGLMALSSGIIVGIVSLFWEDGILPSLVIGLGIIVSVSISASFGLFFPIILHKLKMDPKVASGPVVLMLADVLTTALYLGLASWWLL